MPLVLVSNDANATDRYDWKDITGVQYHYPNGYRNLIRPGEKFVYYRGIRRADGTRGQAEYFGHGVIGDVWRDPDIPEETPKNRWAWYCSIEGFVPFNPPVPAKIGDVFFEDIPRNRWRNGVRSLDEQIFQRILNAAGETSGDNVPGPDSLLPETPKLPGLDEVTIPTDTRELLVSPKGPSAGGGGNGSGRRSKHARIIGRRAEEIALKWINANYPGAQNLRWVSRDGETPGWDIEFTRDDGELVAVEVKGASGKGFVNFELTANELQASKRLGDRYLLVLVADCLGTSPSLQIISDPAARFASGELGLEPVLWRVFSSANIVRD